MAERSKQAPKVNADDTLTQEELAEQAHAELPPPGYARDEQQRYNIDELQRQAEELVAKHHQGTIDLSKLAMQNEFMMANKYLRVSNPQPGFVYRWTSKNRFSQHIQQARSEGWEVVQGDMPEAVELKGGGIPGMGSPGTTRELNDVILMRMPHDKWIVIKSLRILRQQKIQQASSANLIEMAGKYSNVMTLHAWKMPNPDGQFTGPEIRSHALGRRPLGQSGGSTPEERSAYPQNLAELEDALRGGTASPEVLQRLGV